MYMNAERQPEQTAVDRRIQSAIINSEERQKVHLDIKIKELKDVFSSAFPGGDPAIHRAYHEAQIQLMKDRSEAWKSIRDKTLAGLLWTVLGVLGVALLEAFRKWIIYGGPK